MYFKVSKKKIFAITTVLFLFLNSPIWGEVSDNGLLLFAKKAIEKAENLEDRAEDLEDKVEDFRDKVENFIEVKENLEDKVENLKEIKEKFEKIGEIPDHNPTLVKDEAGNLYLVWEYGNELWWASNKGKGWDNYGKIPDAEGTRPVLAYIRGLLQNDNREGLFCAWETIPSPKKIMSALGKLRNGEITWSKPKALTFDDHDDYGLALVSDKEDRPIITWLQQASVQEDDSDLYYKRLIPEDLSFNWRDTSNITQQEDVVPPAALGGAFTCFNHVFANGAFLIPRIIPIIGGVRGFELSGSICGETGLNPLASLYSSIFSSPASISSLNLNLTRGNHIESQIVLFALDDAVPISNVLQEKARAFGGYYKKDFLSLPIPLAPFSVPVGTTRIGARIQTGAQITFIQKPYFSQEQAKTALLSLNPFEDKASGSLFRKLDFSFFPGGGEVDFLFEVGMGGVGKISSYGGGINGEIFVVGGEVRRYAFTSSPSFEFLAAPYITTGGFVRVSGDWNGISFAFDRTVIFDGRSSVFPRNDSETSEDDSDAPSIDPNHPLRSIIAETVEERLHERISGLFEDDADTPSIDPDHPIRSIIAETVEDRLHERISGLFEDDTDTPSADPNHPFRTIIAESGKDRLLQRTFGLLEDNVSLFEELEFVKKPFQGKGSVYEGKPVLSDLVNDIYHDGLPSVAKSKSGEIILAWIKDFASSFLGTKVFSSHYDGDKWSKPLEITSDFNFNKDAAVVFDSHGIPMVAWSSASNHGLDYEKSTVAEILEAMNKSDIMYSQFINRKWTAPKPLARLLGKDEQISLASGPDGEITAAWINSARRGSSLYSSFWDGKKWSEPKLITRAALAEPPKVIYQSNKVLVVWSQDKDGNLHTFDDWCLYSSYRDGSSWSSPSLFLRKVKRIVTR